MIRSLVLCALAALVPFAPAFAGKTDERQAVIRVLKERSEALPEEKRERAAALIADFESGQALTDFSFGWSRAEPLLRAGGPDALIAAANAPDGPLRYARADALLAAGYALYDRDARGAKRLNAALLELAHAAEDFERPVYAHAAAELAALRCDKDRFERALGLLPQSRDGTRYAYWRARIDGGGAEAVTSGLALDPEGEDTSAIRQVIDGYRLIDDFGYCNRQAPL